VRRRRSLRLARALWLAIPLVAGVVAYRHRLPLLEGLALLPQARVGWLALGAAMVGVIYLARANVYRVPLRVLDYSVRPRFLFAIAVVATTVHQLIPTAGASGYAFLTFALHRQGVSSGQASLVALIDTLSYAVAMATLVGGSLVYLLGWAQVPTPVLRAGVLPALAIVALAVFVYVAQRRRDRLERLVMGGKHRLERLRGRRWADAPVRTFLAEYHRGKAVIVHRPGRFLQMLVLQYVAVGADAAALYLAFLALGMPPKPWTVFMGLVVAMTGGAVLGAPAGGGGFELIMTGFFAHQGVGESRAFAATLLYRLLAFWLPVAVSLIVLLWVRRRHRDVRKQ
jgi:uncharacterized protein (TIRG00374 family)